MTEQNDQLEPPEFGVSSEALADWIGNHLDALDVGAVNPGVIDACMGQILNVGDERYSYNGFYQHFEVADMEYLFDKILVHLEALINYASMMTLRLERSTRAMDDEMVQEKIEQIPTAILPLMKLVKILARIHGEMQILEDVVEEVMRVESETNRNYE